MGLADWIAARLTRLAGPSDRKVETVGPSVDLFAEETGTRTVMITMIGIASAHVEEIVATTRTRFPRSRLVYITDSLDFMHLRRLGALFEYLPPALEQRLHASEMPWRAYLERRWELLLAKWRPVHVLSYGENIETYLVSAPGDPRRTDDAESTAARSS